MNKENCITVEKETSYKVNLKFLEISNPIANSKVESLKNILARVYLRVKDNKFLLDNGKEDMVVSSETSTTIENE